MGSRAYGLLELRHVIRRSVRALEGASAASVTSLRGFYVSKIQAAEGISLRRLPPSGALYRSRRPSVSIRLINRAPFRLWKLPAERTNGERQRNGERQDYSTKEKLKKKLRPVLIIKSYILDRLMLSYAVHFNVVTEYLKMNLIRS